MKTARSRRRKTDEAARKVRAALLRCLRIKRNLIAIDYGTVTRIDRRWATIAFLSGSEKAKETKARDFPTWRLHDVKADFVGARVKHVTIWLGRDMPDMVVSRLMRVGPAISVKPTRPQRRLTAREFALLDRDSSAEGDKE